MNTILIPTDYSEESANAARFGIKLAEALEARVIFLHISQVEIPIAAADVQKKIAKDFHKDQQLNLVEQTTSWLPTDFKNEIIHLCRISAIVVETIMEVADGYNVDLIVMGTRGASGIKKYFLGSNTASLIQKAKQPVMAIPSHFAREGIRHIVYASELVHIETELKEIIKYAKILNASVEIVHIYPVYPENIDLEKLDFHDLLAKLRTIYEYPNMYIHLFRMDTDNDIHGGLSEFIRVYKPDMLAMYTRHRTFWQKLFDGSKTEEMVYSTRIPLLALKS